MARLIRTPAALFVVAVLIGLAVGFLLPQQAVAEDNHPNHRCLEINCSQPWCTGA